MLGKQAPDWFMCTRVGWSAAFTGGGAASGSFLLFFCQERVVYISSRRSLTGFEVDMYTFLSMIETSLHYGNGRPGIIVFG